MFIYNPFFNKSIEWSVATVATVASEDLLSSARHLHPLDDAMSGDTHYKRGVCVMQTPLSSYSVYLSI